MDLKHIGLIINYCKKHFKELYLSNNTKDI